MKKETLWKILFAAGLCPFLLPFLTSVTRATGWTLLDWLILYSFVYWPTYLAGAVLAGFAAWRLAARKKEGKP